ncbi:MAG: SDR family oxidoreductase [Candidatus Omnitrophota bacterium]|nr:MAG: SDR family oxidoreductase [Candidatus Omnitrophota bacterium]
MRVLVTGHLGYIGTVMVPMLLTEGHDVVGLDSNLYGRCTFCDGITDVPFINKDIRAIEARDLEGFDAVVHLAGLSNDPLGDLNPDLTFEINYKASVRLAQLSKKTGVRRFVFSSSCSNYGAAGENLIDESGELKPVTPYGESKVLVEEDVSKLADSDFSPTFLRSATVYGVSPRLRFDLVLNNLTAWAFTTGEVHLKSDGTPWRPIVHVEDVARAFIAVLGAPLEKVHNGVFNVGITEENYRIRQLAEIVEQAVPNCKIGFAESAGPDRRCYRVDFSKIAKTFPEFKPQWNARRGAEQLYQAYKKIGLALEDFEGPRFKRIAHIKALLSCGELNSSLCWKSENA